VVVVAKCHRDSIPRNVERELWGSSGGHCSNPECRGSLVIFTPKGRAIAIGELAHVIAWSPDGPRGVARDLGLDLDRAENLILLCPTCHKLADDAPDDFPVDTLTSWRDSRASAVRQTAGLSRYETREELVAAIRPLLEENGSVHREYGPESKAAEDPLSTAADTWHRESLGVILPNNSRILEIAAANESLLTQADRDALVRFRVHAVAFSYNQLSGDKDPSAPTFPEEMDRFL
jgi:hypothetical protein